MTTVQAAASCGARLTAQDQCDRVRSNATNERADFEDEEANQEDHLDAEELVQLSIQELECAGRQKVHRAVPPNIIQVFELIRNVRDRGSNDGVV